MLLLALFIAVPLLEIALFIQLGSIMELGWILLIVVLTAILGTWLVRQQGRGVLRQIQGSLDQVRDPTEPLAHGAMILFSGALLLTPGFFTDAVGFLLLVPPVRAVAFRWLRQRVVLHAASSRGRPPPGGMHGRGPAGPQPRPGREVIDGDYEDVTPERGSSPRDDRPSGWTER